MKTRNKIALTAALACTWPAYSQHAVNPSWYVQPHVSGMRPDTDFGVSDREWGGGLRIGQPIHPNWDIQAGMSHVRAEEGASQYRQTLLGVDALLMISRGRLRPFLLLGFGAERDKVENALRRVGRTSPYGTAGLGFQWSFTDQLALQADLRTVRGRLRGEEQFGTSRSNNKYLSIGLNYAFNPPPSSPPAPQAAPAAAPPPEPAPAPAPPPPPAPARFEKVTLAATELFAFNSAALTMPQPRLDQIAAALAADSSITDVDITGYADRLGSAQYNQRLSERRANAVRDYLIGTGIAAGRLKAYGRGEENPIVTCTNKNRAELIKCLEPNRRVEVEQITIERQVP